VNLALAAAVLVAVAGVAFAVGRASAPAPSGRGAAAVLQDGGLVTELVPGSSFDPNGGGFVVGGGPDGTGAGSGAGVFRAGGLTLEGTVESVTADSITIRTADGATVTVGLDTDTTYHQQAGASAADVTTGETVLLRLAGGARAGFTAGNQGGTAGTDGSPAPGTGTLSLGTASDVTVVP
jgi:hypothetical protein